MEITSAIAFTMFVFMLRVCNGQSGEDGDEDPCVYHVVKYGEYYRSVNNTLAQGEEPAGDRYLEENWYRFDSPAGNDIPTTPPNIGSCGTDFPIWLDGVVPDDGDVHEILACSVQFGTDCGAVYAIHVKHCIEFNVYYLVPTNSIAESYCIGQEVPCPPGQSSETGFTPGCVMDGFPILDGNASISFMVDEGDGQRGTHRSVTMVCNLDFDTNPHDILLDISWYFGTKPLIFSEQILKSDLPSTVEEHIWTKYGSIGQTIFCSMRPRYTANSVPGIEVSANYYMGLITKTPEIQLKEDEEAFYIFYSTVPFLTPIDFEHRKLHIEIILPDAPIGDCSTQQASVPNNCSINIEYTPEVGENVEFRVKIYGVIDSAYDGNHEIAMRLRTIKDHPYHEIWGNIDLPDTMITVFDDDIKIGKSICKSQDDPHMTTFDGRLYESQYAGEYILYRHTELPIEVQAYFVRCNNNRATCNCGVAIRAGGDVYIYEKCRKGYPLREWLYNCDEDAFQVDPPRGAIRDITIRKTGTKVRVGPNYVHIIPTLRDFRRTVGLCGTFDNDCSNDFEWRDGSHNNPRPEQITTNCKTTIGKNYEGFSKQWKVDPSMSLYSGNTPANENPPVITLYCHCHNDYENRTPQCHNSPATSFCTSQNKDSSNEMCLMRRRKRELGYTDDDVVEEVMQFPYDATFEPQDGEWRNGWNETTAIDFCAAYLLNRTSTQTCLEYSAVDTDVALSNCVADIFLSGETIFSLGHLEGILNDCDTEIRKNATYYVYDDSSSNSPSCPPVFVILDSVCPLDCSERGICVNSTCHCDEGYTGADCSEDANTVPELYDIQFSGLCDLQTRTCAASPVYGEIFLQSNQLTCRLTPLVLSINGKWVRKSSVDMPAEYRYQERVMCPLPSPDIEEDTLTYAFEIAVANDGATFSNRKNVTVLDSRCMTCVNGDTCTLHDSLCYIGGTCFEHGQSEPSYECNVCNTNANKLDWTEENPKACEKQQPEPSPTAGCHHPLTGGSHVLLPFLVYLCYICD